MSDLIPAEQSEGSIESGAGATRCRYCGAALYASVYFCVGCGTPYKDVALVLSKPLPPVLDEAELIRRKAPNVAALFWSYFAVLLGAAVFSALAFDEDRFDLQIALAEVALLVTTIIWARLHWRTLWAQLKRPGFHPATLVGLLALAPLLLLNYAYHGWLIEMLPEAPPDPLAQLRSVGLSEATVIAIFCVFPAVTEELAFRGLVQHWLATAISPFRALVLASFLFAVMHFSIASLPYLFLVGMLLGWLKWKTGSLYPPMIVHFLHNLIVIEFLWSG